MFKYFLYFKNKSIYSSNLDWDGKDTTLWYICCSWRCLTGGRMINSLVRTNYCKLLCCLAILNNNLTFLFGMKTLKPLHNWGTILSWFAHMQTLCVCHAQRTKIPKITYRYSHSFSHPYQMPLVNHLLSLW